MMPTAARPYTLPGHLVLPEPKLRFGGDSRDAIDVHPLRGLINHGPFSRDKLSAVSDPIRLAVIAPQSGVRRVAGLVHELHQSHKPRERRNYLPDFPGFSRIFGVRLILPNGPTSLELPAALTADVQRSPKPHAVAIRSSQPKTSTCTTISRRSPHPKASAYRSSRTRTLGRLAIFVVAA
jgi:hypothetical protein